MAEQEIVVVEDSANDNGFLKKAAEKNAGANPIRATSKKDMVDKILARLRPGDCIRRLRIIGHGAPGIVGVGDGQGWVACRHINGGEAEYGPELQRLKGKFCPGATVMLEGCDTGAEQAGADKLHALAQFLGVTVEAYTGKVWGDGSTEKGTKVQRATPEGPKPAPIPKAGSGKKK